MQQQRPVPASRFSRLVQLGRLGSGIAGGIAGEGLRQLGSGNRPKAADLLLTPANARRLAERLAEMRGAAMKIGQLLSMEADYLMEAEHLRAYASNLGSQPGLRVPGVAEDLTAGTVLAMEMVDGDPIETLATAPRETRERVSVRLTELALRELFDWRLMQTDPNFANFRYRAEDDEVVLLDFGATRRFGPELVEAFRTLAEASLGDSEGAVEQAATAVGYLAPEDRPAYRHAVVDMVSIAAEPARFPGAYDFGSADLSERMSEHVMRMHTEQGFGRLPPPDMLYIHRKFHLFVSKTVVTAPRWHTICAVVSADPVDHTLNQNVLALAESSLPLSEVRHRRCSFHAQQVTGSASSLPNAAPGHEGNVLESRHLHDRLRAAFLLTAAEKAKDTQQSDPRGYVVGEFHLEHQNRHWKMKERDTGIGRDNARGIVRSRRC